MDKVSPFFSMGAKLMFASHNAGKVAEVRDALLPLGIEVLTPDKLGLSAPDETGTTFIENALIKAKAVAQHTNLPVLADVHN